MPRQLAMALFAVSLAPLLQLAYAHEFDLFSFIPGPVLKGAGYISLLGCVAAVVTAIVHLIGVMRMSWLSWCDEKRTGVENVFFSLFLASVLIAAGMYLHGKASPPTNFSFIPGPILECAGYISVLGGVVYSFLACFILATVLISGLKSDEKRWKSIGGEALQLKYITMEPREELQKGVMFACAFVCLAIVQITAGMYLNGKASPPIDCDVTQWSEWGACNKISESKMRFRSVQVQPSNSGRACPALQEEDKCLEEPVLQRWLTTVCLINSGTKELAVALQGLGVDTQEDLRFVKEPTVDALPGIPEVRRERLKAFIQTFQDRELSFGFLRVEQELQPQSHKGVVWNLGVAFFLGPHPRIKQSQIPV